MFAIFSFLLSFQNRKFLSKPGLRLTEKSLGLHWKGFSEHLIQPIVECQHLIIWRFDILYGRPVIISQSTFHCTEAIIIERTILNLLFQTSFFIIDKKIATLFYLVTPTPHYMASLSMTSSVHVILAWLSNASTWYWRVVTAGQLSACAGAGAWCLDSIVPGDQGQLITDHSAGSLSSPARGHCLQRHRLICTTLLYTSKPKQLLLLVQSILKLEKFPRHHALDWTSRVTITPATTV